MALQHQSRLRLPTEPDTLAHFRVEITDDEWKTETVLEALGRELAEDVVGKRPLTVGTTPLVSVELLQVAMMVRKKLGVASSRAESRTKQRRV